MAFFDEISKKITSTGQSAVKKTKDVAEVARLNSLVADEERNSEALYREIGKLYVKLHQNDCEEQFASLIDSVRKSNNTVLALKKQINDIKKVSDCPNCGASVPVNAAFCSVCGNKIEAKSSSQGSSSLKCSKCGKEVKAGSKFCMECGNKIEPEDNAVVEKSVSSKAALPKIEKKAVDAAEQSLDMRKCPACGHMQKKDMPFCTSCGAKFENAESVKKSVEVKKASIFEKKSEKVNAVPQLSGQDSDMRKCPACGHMQKKDMHFCTGCGAKFENAESVKKSVEVKKVSIFEKKSEKVNAASQPSGEDSDMRKCPVCGHLQKKELPFCTNCGADMEAKKNAENPSIQKKPEPKKTEDTVLALPTEALLKPDEYKCPVCGNIQKNSFPFCTDCGARRESKTVETKKEPSPKVPAIEKKLSDFISDVKDKKDKISSDSQERKCPVCGSVQKNDFPFCTECGAKMDDNKPAAPLTKAAVVEKKLSDIVSDKKDKPAEVSKECKCPVCGSVQKKKFPFCTECGAKIEISDRDSNLSSADVKGKSEEAPLANKDAGDKLSKVQEVQQVSAAAFAVSVTEVSANVAVSAVNEKAADDDDDEDSATVMLMPDVSLPPVIPYIVRKKTNETFRISKAICKIGRDKGVNDFVVSGNKFIGHTHCHIITRNEEYFIVDDNSMNHTFVDDIMIPPNVEVKLTHGKTIKLANEEFEFKIF